MADKLNNDSAAVAAQQEAQKKTNEFKFGKIVYSRGEIIKEK